MHHRICGLLIMALMTSIGGCAAAFDSPHSGSDGKCHSDYNAPSCIYLF